MIDKNPKHKGFVYFTFKDKEVDSLGRGKYRTIKIGCSKNPLFRIGEHTFLNPKKDTVIHRISRCFDYLKCEAEIKKLTDGKEIFPIEKGLGKKINKVMDKYNDFDLDLETFYALLHVDTLKRYFKNNGKNKNG